MTKTAQRRRHPAAALALLLLGLLLTGGAYATAGVLAEDEPVPTTTSAADQTVLDEGRRLYLEGCSSCHGMEAQGADTGPTLIGVGEAGVHFQVATGRMPLAGPAAQAKARKSIYTEEQIDALATYIASLAPGPASPTAEQLDLSQADPAVGGELFRANCSQCHQAAGRGGALTEGKYAPGLLEATDREIYEAMITGPQNMPVFADTTLSTSDKQDLLAYIGELRTGQDPGGWSLGRFGPVTEGLFLWTAGLLLVIAAAVWIGAKVR